MSTFMKLRRKALHNSGAEPVAQVESLEATLSELSGYGRPMLFQRSNGEWRCSVEMNNSTSHTTVDVVAVDTSPRNAATQLLKNVRSTIDALAK